jgi:general secretion pathway protein J
MSVCKRVESEVGEAGFTLIELLAALIVTALCLAAVVTGVRLLGRSGERGAHVIARQDMLSRGVDVLRRDIAQLQRVVHRRDRDSEFVFAGDEKRLTFVAIEPPVPSDPGPYFVVYSVEQGEKESALVRSRAPYDAMAKDIHRLPTHDEVTVLEGPYVFRFGYLRRDAGGERWVSRWQDRDRLPALIKLEIGVRGHVPELPPLIFRPHVDAEQACIKDKMGLCTLRTAGVLVTQPAGDPERKN